MGLELAGLSKSYGAQRAVSEVSLTIDLGRLVCFLGPSGCGKTTLLRMIAGLETPSAGSIRLDGRDLTDMPAHLRNFGMVFQALALFPHLSVEDNIAYSLRLRGKTRKERREVVRELLELVHLPDVARRRVDQLSGGQRQRVAIARALAAEPRLFLMDEPLSALDQKLREHLQIEIRQLQQALKITTIFVTHDQHEAMTIADEVVIMADGKVQQVGPPMEVYRRPANRFVADFIGRSNLIAVDVIGDGAVRLGDRVISVADVPAKLRNGALATLCVRPEDVILTPDLAPESNFDAEVLFARELGSSVEVRLATGGDEWLAWVPPSRWAELSSSRRVGMALRPGSAVVLAE